MTHPVFVRLLAFTCLFLAFTAPSGAQIITTVGGTGTVGYTGDGGPAMAAEMSPAAVAMDTAGNLYFSDQAHSCVRKINTAGIISTVAGNGSIGYSGDGGPATAAEFNGLIGIAVDLAGNIYIADGFNNRVRKVNTAGIITTVAGCGLAGYYGDTGPALSAGINFPSDVAVDASGNLYICDFGNFCIRMVNTSGIITTVAGNGMMGYSGDGGPATAAELTPNNVNIDAAGNIYIGDGGNNCSRMVNTSGIITTIAGGSTAGFSGDGGPATAAELNSPGTIIKDASGNLYIPDAGNNRIRKINTTGIITTFAGDGISGFSGDGGPATAAAIGGSGAAVIDAAGAIYFPSGNRIRKISSGTPNIIWGSAIFTGPSITDSTCKVWLIEYDSATTTLTAIDSTTTCIVSNASFYEFNGEPNHNYLIKAALVSGPDSGSGYVPTYHSSSFYWDTATYVNHTGGNDGNENITMQYGTVTGGPGFIAGNVMSGANKGTTTLAPVPNMLILLRNAANHLVAFTHTDASGNYSFSNLANGNYNVYPEDLGYTTTPAVNLDVTSTSESVTNVTFVQHTISKTITPGSNGVTNILLNKTLSIYPNPASSSIIINSAEPITGIAISNLLGQTLINQNNNSKQVQVDVTDLPAGVYLVKINGTDVRKFIKQ